MPVRSLRSAAIFFGFLIATSAPAQTPAAPERFRLGTGLAERGLPEEASKEFEAFLKEAPRDVQVPEAWYRLGACRAELGRTEPAIEAFEKALKSGGQAFALRPECRYRLGLAYRAAGRNADAAKVAELVAAESREGHYLAAAALFLAGEAWRDAGKPEAAETAFLAAAEADASADAKYAAPALYAAGFVALDAAKFAPAAERFALVFKRAPNHEAAPEARYLAGDALLRAGRAADALPLLTASSAATSTFADDAAFAAGRALAALGRDDESEAVYRSFAGRFPDSDQASRVRLELARAAYRRGRAREAAEIATALAADPKLDAALRPALEELAGLSLLESGAAADAERHLLLALKDVGDDLARKCRLSYALGEVCTELGRFEDALTAYRGAGRASADDLAGDARYGEALALHKLGRFAEAIKVLDAESAERPAHRLAVETAFAGAENRFTLRRYAEADPLYARVPEGHALGRKAAIKRAWCAFLAPDPKTARERFEAVAASAAAGDPAGEEALAMTSLAAWDQGDADGALAAADRYRARHGSGVHLGKTERVAARVLKARGDLRGAAARLAAASAAGPKGGEDPSGDRLIAAELAFRQGDFAGAQEIYSALADRKDADGARALEGVAWCAFELGDDAACRRAVERGLKHPESAVVAPGLRELDVAAKHKAGKFPEAAAAARGFLKAHPDHPRANEVRYALGVALARSGKSGEARDVFVALGDGVGLARPDLLHYEAGWTFKKTGDEDAALARFQAAAKSTKDAEILAECLLHAGERLLVLKRTDEARAALSAVQGKHRGAALYRLGFSWLAEEKFAEATESFRSLLATDDPAFVHEAAFLLGDVLCRRKDFAAAASPLRRVVAEAPEHARAQAARRLLAEAELGLGKNAEAAVVAEEFLRRDDGKERAETARTCLRLGRARAKLKDFAAAEKAFAKAAELSDGETGAEAQFRIGEVRRDAGDLSGAAEAWLRLSILYGHAEWASEGLYEAGAAFEKLGKPDRAKKLWTEVVERFGATSAAKKARAKLGASGG